MEIDKVGAELTEAAAIIRGVVLNSMTMLERCIDIFISTHFCAEHTKKRELMLTVFATKSITFENKRMLFNHLLNTHTKKYDKSTVKGLHKKLDEFNKVRNKLAHCSIDTTDTAVERFRNTKEVIFIDLNKDWIEIPYTVEKAQEYANLIASYISPVVAFY